MITEGWVIFATDASDEGRAEAKAWCRAQGFTVEDVRIVIREEKQCLVIAKRNLTPKLQSV
jgi:hypothetical protein